MIYVSHHLDLSQLMFYINAAFAKVTLIMSNIIAKEAF